MGTGLGRTLSTRQNGPMRAPRLQLLIAATVAVLVLGGCGSSSGAGDQSGSDEGDSPTTTAVSPAHAGLNEQSTGSGATGSEATGANGGAGGEPLMTDAEREAALCEPSAGSGAGDAGPAASGSGDAKNYAAVAEGLGDAISDKCEDRAKP